MAVNARLFTLTGERGRGTLLRSTQPTKHYAKVELARLV